MIAQRRTPEALSRLDRLLAQMQIEVSPVTAAQVLIARQAFTAYGKGAGSRAGLNFGDWFGYALARERNEPLLYRGDDFTHTDVLKV